jgi:hypothetical protein
MGYSRQWVADILRSSGYPEEADEASGATPAEAVRFRYPNGGPQAVADALIEGLTLMRADTAGFRTDTVKRLLGRRPRTFADWCARNASAFLDTWAPSMPPQSGSGHATHHGLKTDPRCSAR